MWKASENNGYNSIYRRLNFERYMTVKRPKLQKSLNLNFCSLNNWKLEFWKRYDCEKTQDRKIIKFDLPFFYQGRKRKNEINWSAEKELVTTCILIKPRS